MPTVRQAFSYATLTFFVSFVFFFGLNWQLTGQWLNTSTSRDIPDFSRYQQLTTLPAEGFPTDDRKSRVILIGDVHGMDKPLHTLLGKLSYTPKTDVLIHVGDIIAKGSHTGSLAVLSWMTSNNITGVRGNHDQKVIEWRGWLDWISTLPGGQRWLEQAQHRFLEAEKKGADLEVWEFKERKRDRSWWKTVPDGWILFGDHFRIARAMSKEHYAYLLSLPLKLHIPSAHAFVVHAGVLPSDPRYPPYHKRQPLSHVPVLSARVKHDMPKGENSTLPLLRRLQEGAILNEVPQNTDPWVTLNMRGVQKHDVTRGKGGTPWSDVWKDAITHCDGFEHEVALKKHKDEALPCYPVTVIYGHAASRGLDVKRWSIGLDSGCVYKRRLTALVLGGKPHKRADTDDADDVDAEMEVDADDDDPSVEKHKHKSSFIPFGDNKEGKLVSVKCP